MIHLVLLFVPWSLSMAPYVPPVAEGCTRPALLALLALLA